ncbi:MAG: adenylate/guanylate cyclase domain-containing protein [Desulfuromonas sp.]|nr:adenylate/guanylate cyclase domain-containing protein [Desulfuromonas sp.]
MKVFSTKYLVYWIAAAIFLVYSASYLLMECWVFQAPSYQATPQTIRRQEKAREFFSRALQADSHFQVFLARFLHDRPNPAVVLLDVDYDVISEADAWPLPRNIYAEIFSRLAEGKPKVVLVDLIFERPQTPWVADAIFQNINEQNAQLLMPVVNQLNHDGQLKDALAQSSYVLITVLAGGRDFSVPALREQYAATLVRHVSNSPPVEVSGSGVEQVFPRARIIGLRESILPLQLGARGQGFTLLNFDRYGSASEMPCFHRLQTPPPENRSVFLPHATIETIRVFEGADRYQLTIADGQASTFRIGSRTIRTSPSGDMAVNFYNRTRIPVVRAHDLLQGKVPPQSLAGKIVVFSSDTDFLHDYVETPFGLVWGAEAMAYELSNILNEDYFYRPAWAGWFEFGLLGALLAAVLACCAALKPSRAALAVALLVIATAALIGTLYVFRHQIFSVTIPVSFAIIVFVQATLIRVVREEHQKRFFKNALSLYLSPELSEQVAEKPELLGLQGKEETLTVLFSDIRNFSSISESMTPEELTAFLQHYFSPMTDIIFATEGTLDKYIGDAIMAFWGAPLPQDDHATRACEAALRMLEALDLLLQQQQQTLANLPPIRMGIGIHSGRMRVGNMGSARRLNYTVIGDNVNLGSRLEGLTKHYGVRLIVSEQTWDALGGNFYGRRLDRVKVKGKEEPVTIYEVLGRGEPPAGTREALVTWDRALQAYEQQQWDLGSQLFGTWADDRGDLTAAIYLKAIAHYRIEERLENWPPVSVMTEK